MGGAQVNRCYIVLMIICVGFMIDALFLHNLVSWHSRPLQTGRDARGRPGHTKHSATRQSQETKDIRSISMFRSDNNLPYVESRKSSNSETPTIPHIIHQTWDTEHIPKTYHKWLATWKKHNPHWEYWFWTLDEIQRFVAKEYPELVRLHDVYTANIFRFDMMRYLVLYKYGGIYLDLDMECLKPLDNWTYGYQCIISEETYAHPFVVREQPPPANIVNGFIAARPNHPFIKKTIDSLEEFAGYYLGDYLHATGPFFFNSVLQRYASENRSKDDDDITVLPPKYFFPTFDPNESDLISSRCFPGKLELLHKAGQMTCNELNHVFLQRTPDKCSYTDHHWVHAYLYHDDWKKANTKPIHDLVPGVVTKHT